MNALTENSSLNSVKTWKRVVLWAALFLCFFISGVTGWIAFYANSHGPAIDSDSVVVEIPRGTSMRGISALLGEAGIIKDDVRFLILAKWRGVAGKLRAGEFSLPTGKKPLEILEFLAHAKPLQHVVTIPEGLRAEEIAGIFAQEGWCDAEQYLTLVHDRSFIEKLGLQGIESLEGFLYPDTYYLTRDVRQADQIIEMQVKRFHDVWNSLIQNAPPELVMRDTVILASIVEKETGDAAERPLIASVFHNRLKKGMRLQSDPTVTYGVKDFSGPITKKLLRQVTPYNTYVIPALPAGPIANPGKAALHAVIFPATSNYLYFVAKNDGTHKFSTKLKDHNRAVQKYLRKKKSKNGKE